MKRIALVVTCLAALGLAACSGGTGSSVLPSVAPQAVARHTTDLGGGGPTDGGMGFMSMRMAPRTSSTPAPAPTP